MQVMTWNGSLRMPKAGFGKATRTKVISRLSALWSFITFIVGAVSASFIWYLKYRKLSGELKSLRMQHLAKRHEYDRDVNETDKALTAAICAYVNLIPQPVKNLTGLSTQDLRELSEARETACGALGDYLSSLCMWTESNCQVNVQDKTRLEADSDGLVRNLRLCKRCLEILNNRRTLDALDREPYKVSKHTIAPIRIVIQQLPIEDRQKQQMVDDIYDLLKLDDTRGLLD